MDFDEWEEAYKRPHPETTVKDMMRASYEAGRESVIANRETFQKVKAEGIRQGIKEGMARAKEIIRNVVYTDSQVLYRQRQNLLEELQSVDFLSVYKEIDNE